MSFSLPALPRPTILADLCREAAIAQRVPPASLEKDLYLSRLLWALADRFGQELLLKGGTCLMKIDVGLRRMSEDIDLVIPWAGSLSHKGTNAGRTNRVRDVLREMGPKVGIELETPDGEGYARRSHVKWTIHYVSEFGRRLPSRPSPTATIDVEASMRPVLLQPRTARIRTALTDALVGDYAQAVCCALDFGEVRAEKVRAAFTREEPQIRDYYDLGLLLDSGADMASEEFVQLTNRKLAEVNAAPLAEQPPRFGLVGERLRDLEQGRARGLEAVVRLDEPQFDLDRVLQAYDSMWTHLRHV